MDIYLVGGAVRDALLGLDVHERDWVVVGATPADLLQAGYQQVGRDFPVFLHPQTHEEYALARTERKTAPGYHGFAVHAAPDVTLEDDLFRRDLTINAMAQAADGRLIDPCGGRADLDARLLRHVSPAFAEDPLRVLRVARFAARFAGLGFRVADATLDLMRAITDAGEIDTLVPERVCAELQRAFTTAHPDVFLRVLHDCGALARLMPEVDALFGVPQRADYHPEVDTGVHLLLTLQAGVRLGLPPVGLFALLAHDLGKALTPESILPSHHRHEDRGIAPTRQLCQRLRVPRDWHDLALLTVRWHTHVHRARELRPDTLLKLFEATDALRRPERFLLFVDVCTADARGRTGFEDDPYPQAELLRQALQRLQAVSPASLDPGLAGAALGAALRAARLQALTPS